MKKILLTAAVAMATFTTGFSQAFLKAPERAVQTTQESEDLVWLQNYKTDFTSYTRFGAGAQAEFGTAAGYSKEQITPYKGKSVSAMRIYLADPLKNPKFYILKGENPNNATEIASKTVTSTAIGWNYIKFDTPIELNDDENLFIGYVANISADAYPSAMDMVPLDPQKDANKVFYYYGGQYTDVATFTNQGQYPYAGLGHPIMSLLVDGDVEILGNSLALDGVNGITRYVENGTKVQPELIVRLNSFNEVTEATVTYSINGEEKSENFTIDPSLKPYENKQYTLKMPEITADQSMELAYTITKVNGKENFEEFTYSTGINPYDKSKTAERKILIEKFTGQDCGYCPGGEQSILQAIKGNEDRVARIDHHAGYYPDIFTREESWYVASYFGVSGAPNCMVDRTFQADFGSVAFHPGYLSQVNVISNSLETPGLATVKIEDTYNAETRELTVKVSGEGSVDLKGKKINVVLTQSGYTARQASGGTTYVHNDFPIVFLTDVEGDALTVNADNTYEMTFNCKIEKSYINNSQDFPAQYPEDVNVDLNQLKIVAFISDAWSGYYTDAQVLNAEVVECSSKGAVNAVAEENIRIFTADSRIAVEGDYTSIEVFTIDGAQIENTNLARGLYIAKVVADGKVYTQKVMVK